MPDLYYDHSIDLAIERKGMKAWRRAVRQILLARPVTESPYLAGLYPDAESLFHAVDTHAASLEIEDPLRRGWEDISEWVRMHPDVEMFRLFLDVTEEWLDQFFRDAMAAEATA